MYDNFSRNLHLNKHRYNIINEYIKKYIEILLISNNVVYLYKNKEKHFKWSILIIIFYKKIFKLIKFWLKLLFIHILS